ncbi:putative BRO1-like domain containing protein [Lyophyllum shimeji]|uniref:BRO1-like domain containing protein n=1 Tax=Lyophyllum shimeji TaxID=47721 RepID=A0A9P3PRU2_LYOSH|nr:putative BRO1-like domain containing protein [Lyophyllum shimeji]
MSNLLSIPFKKTYPVNVKEPARNYIYTHGGVHPDEFKDDINLWQNLRKDGVGGVVHVDRINASLLYHAQLVSILTKLPPNIELEIAYAPVFQASAVPITLKNLVFERCGVLFNLASLYSQLAASEDRATMDGIKRGTANYQYAAGVLSFLRTSALPKLVYSPEDEEIPRDLSDSFATALELLMLAQAQECSWQMAKLNQYKNGLIAKVAARAAALYQMASKTIHDASPPIKDLFPSHWLPHIEAKGHHFFAVSQYRKSIDEIESSRYGVEIARLHEAQSEAKKGYDIARRGRIAPAVIQDIQSLLEVVQKNLARAERDNDLIYHHDVPASSALAPIPQANLVSSTIPAGLSDPTSVVGNGRMIFGELLSWGAKEAINIYNDRKQNLIKDKIKDASSELQDAADQALRRLNLPAALEALERPIGLPPSLLRKAEEVRLENGPAKIEASIEDVQRLAQQDQAILDEAMDILDNEASEDEAARKYATLNRLPSHEANVELIEKEKRYRSILAQAATSDETVRQKWDEWEKNIVELTWSEEELEASIPSSTLSSSAAMTAEGRQTQTHARALRVHLEALDDLHRVREQIMRRAQALAAADDIRERVLKAAAGLARLTEVEPAMFEDVSDEELAKYDRFLAEMGEIEQRQAAILLEIQRRNELFLQSRKDDPAVKEREHALQSLDLAYHKYREITRNLDEGFKFYNDLATIFLQYKEACKNWSRLRNQQIHALTRSLQSMSLGSSSSTPPTPAAPAPILHPDAAPDASANVNVPASPRAPPMKQAPSPPPRKAPLGKSSLGLPAITSSDWGFEDVQLPPPPARRQ